MRFVIGLLAAIVSIPVVAQQAAYLELPRTNEVSVGFIDIGGIKRSGRDVEVQYLYVTARPEGEATPVEGSLRTYLISCDWQAYAMSASAEIDLNGNIISTRTFDSTRGFYSSRSFAAVLAAIACVPNQVAKVSAESLKDAMSIGARSTKRPPPRKPRDPNEPIPTAVPAPKPKVELLQNFPRPNPSEYGVVRVEKGTGNALFIDWANLKRTKQHVMVMTLEVLAAGSAKDAYQSTIKVSSIEIRCKARTIWLRGFQPFAGNFSPQREEPGEREKTVTGSTHNEELLRAACKSRKPRKTFASMAEAVAQAAAARE